MQCFVYCRVSTEEQASDDHFSLANQEQRARDYASAKGWRVLQVEKDVASGKDAERRGYKGLISAIRKASVDCVLVYRLDRLSRNVRDVYDFLDLIKQHGVAFVSMQEGFDTTTAMGRAMLGMAAVFAQLTREMIAENVRDGLMRRAQAGLYNGNQCGPYGYRYDKSTKNLDVVPEHAERVREIYRLYAERKWGANRIASYLNESGIAMRGGGQWSTPQVRSLLRNPAYVGKTRWHDEVFQGKHEAIVSQELWDSAQGLINARRRIPSRSHSSGHLLSGIAECGQCGRKLIAHYGLKRKNGTRYVSYSHYKDVQRGACKPFHKSAPKLENTVLAVIRRAAASKVLEGLAAEELRKQIETTGAPLCDRRDVIVSELSELRSSFSAWADRLDRKLITEDQFALQNKRLIERESALRKELGEIDVKLAANEDVEVSFEAARVSLGQFPDVWANLEMQERRELLRNLIERLRVYPDKVVVKPAFLPESVIAV